MAGRTAPSLFVKVICVLFKRCQRKTAMVNFNGNKKKETTLKKTWEIIKKDIKEYWVAVLFAGIVYAVMKLIFGGVCISVALTGLPCPGCGMTRGVVFLLTGQFERAFMINPAVYLWVGVTLYFLIFRYILHRKAPGIVWIFKIILITTILIYIYRMIRYFPDRPPMSYTRGRILEKLIPGYYEFISRFL